MKKLNKKQKKQIAAIAAKNDADIDLTDMPEVLDWSKAEIGKFYRPAKKPVTIRLDTDIIAWLKSYGRANPKGMRHSGASQRVKGVPPACLEKSKTPLVNFTPFSIVKVHDRGAPEIFSVTPVPE